MGLKRALNRAGAILIAGCLYPAYHFGPTRLLPADPPSLGEDWSLATLMELAKVFGQKRFQANWARFFLLLMHSIPRGKAQTAGAVHTSPARPRLLASRALQEEELVRVAG